MGTLGRQRRHTGGRPDRKTEAGLQTETGSEVKTENSTETIDGRH